MDSAITTPKIAESAYVPAADHTDVLQLITLATSSHSSLLLYLTAEEDLMENKYKLWNHDIMILLAAGTCPSKKAEQALCR